MKISHLLPKVLDDERIWKDLFEVMDEVIGEANSRRITKLANRHNIDQLVNIERGKIIPLTVTDDADTEQLLIKFADFLGYSYEDSERLQVTDFLRYVEEGTQFIHEKGTPKYVDFFSFLISNPIDVYELWYDPTTQGFFVVDDPSIMGRRRGIDGLTATQNVYATPYVRLEGFDTRFRDFTEQLRLFYSIAPMDVVVGEVTSRLTLSDVIFGMRYNAYEDTTAIIDTTPISQLNMAISVSEEISMNTIYTGEQEVPVVNLYMGIAVSDEINEVAQ